MMFIAGELDQVTFKVQPKLFHDSVTSVGVSGAVDSWGKDPAVDCDPR